jgi:hypothetical protein
MTPHSTHGARVVDLPDHGHKVRVRENTHRWEEVAESIKIVLVDRPRSSEDRDEPPVTCSGISDLSPRLQENAKLPDCWSWTLSMRHTKLCLWMFYMFSGCLPILECIQFPKVHVCRSFFSSALLCLDRCVFVSNSFRNFPACFLHLKENQF